MQRAILTFLWPDLAVGREGREMMGGAEEGREGEPKDKHALFEISKLGIYYAACAANALICVAAVCPVDIRITYALTSA